MYLMIVFPSTAGKSHRRNEVFREYYLLLKIKKNLVLQKTGIPYQQTRECVTVNDFHDFIPFLSNHAQEKDEQLSELQVNLMFKIKAASRSTQQSLSLQCKSICVDMCRYTLVQTLKTVSDSTLVCIK